ncbi:MAG: zinc ribbon domain-containing protein [Calditrichaeota bacterium]|nr:zinc ribbon domain-containing protein [Calditrichota bacterium]
MPIYDFICRNCGKQFEQLTPYNWQSAGVTCPLCGSVELDKAVSLVGAFQSGGKIQSLSGSAAACSHCSTGTCSTCH